MYPKYKENENISAKNLLVNCYSESYKKGKYSVEVAKDHYRLLKVSPN